MTDITLKLFCEKNGIYPGINKPNFAQLEYLATLAKTNGAKIPHLGLFGEASCGKTTAIKLLAKELDYDFLTYNSCLIANFESLNKDITSKVVDDKSIKENFYLDEGEFVFNVDKPHIILFDEAHGLTKHIQNALLTVLSEGGKFHPSATTVNVKNIVFVFATTDTSKLIYPLQTRLLPITFDQYTPEDISAIISLKYPNIEENGRKILAECSKFVPRKAIQISETLASFHKDAEIITVDNVTSYVKRFLNMEINGIDTIDKRILLYLARNKKDIKPIDEISFKYATEIVTKLETKGLDKLTSKEHKEYNAAKFQATVLKMKLEKAEYAPKSRQDISLACRLLDEDALETRLAFLEKLSYITKTPKGILLNEKYLE